MCKWGTTKPVFLVIPADLSHTGEAIMETVDIDSCIADIVMALAHSGILTRGSCCGHGKADGEISLQDGRQLIIKHKTGGH